MKQSVVIGKFYPLHKGHQYLIETAKSNSNLTVIVCHKTDYKIPGKIRANWIKQLYPDVNVILIDCEGIPEEDSKLWAEMTIKWLGYRPDLVFTSEKYGQKYSEFMGAKHVLVDLDREKISISGTKVRENLYKNWDYLDKIVQEYFLKKICIVGAESTGTTTLAKALAAYYKTSWVPEYGRTYWEGKLNTPNADDWNSREFTFIANQQNMLEDQLVKTANKILICDTNSWVTSVWYERYIGKQSKNVENISKDRKYDLYIVTGLDIPFVQDGTRDGEHIREWMHNKFIKLLKYNNHKFIEVKGSKKDRLDQSVEEIEKIFLSPF